MPDRTIPTPYAELVEQTVEEIDAFLADYLSSRSDLIKYGLIPVDRIRFGLVARLRKNLALSPSIDTEAMVERAARAIAKRCRGTDAGFDEMGAGRVDGFMADARAALVAAGVIGSGK